jgi:hypothetical protein
MGDIAIDPSALKLAPRLEESLTAAGFTQDVQEVGRWLTTRQIDVDPVTVKVVLLVPEAVGGPGRRAARIGDHGKRTARKARASRPRSSTGIGWRWARSMRQTIAVSPSR